MAATLKRRDSQEVAQRINSKVDLRRISRELESENELMTSFQQITNR